MSCSTDSGGAHRVLVGRCEGKEPLGRLRHTWEDRFKMDRQEVGRGHDFKYALFMLSNSLKLIMVDQSMSGL